MNSKFKIQKFCLFCLILVLFGASCVSSLETPECGQARTSVKKFYSFHFGSEMKPSEEYLDRRAKFLSSSLKQQLEGEIESAKDYFTQTEDYPKAFSVGACETVSPEKTDFDVLLFWKDNKQTEQRKIKVEMINQNGDWLVNRVN